MTSIKVKPQKTKAFSNQNKGHLGSTYMIDSSSRTLILLEDLGTENEYSIAVYYYSTQNNPFCERSWLEDGSFSTLMQENTRVQYVMKYQVIQSALFIP